jgi:hypothetical protein
MYKIGFATGIHRYSTVYRDILYIHLYSIGSLHIKKPLYSTSVCILDKGLFYTITNAVTIQRMYRSIPQLYVQYTLDNYSIAIAVPIAGCALHRFHYRTTLILSHTFVHDLI